MDIASKTGTPIMRHMFFDFYDDEICYVIDDQYMFGNDILFAPILDEGQTKRSVYLPEGEWTRTTDKTVHSGKQYVECSAAIDEFIAFVKNDADVLNVF